ncbi:MAG: DndE family protein [Oscillospiraceae bacterium]
MVFKIRTSQKTADIFNKMNASINYAPFTLSKLAISMSLKSGKPLQGADYETDSLGLELNRQTITGEWDILYKCLVELFEGHHIDDDEYFQKYLKAHLDRGAKMIYSEFQYNSDFLLALLSDKTGI